ncbi:MAG TPA: hypothetical protein GX707_08465 [Epulopiscium sp.]|nr:hypothetical protein [Candidatus Epulonipiscium sp.]
MDTKKIENIIQSISDPIEKSLLKRILDLVYRAQKTYSVTYTDFVDPFLLGKIKSYRLDLLGINLLSYGGLPASERQIIGLAHDEIDIEEDEFPIGYLKISVKTGIGKPLSHRDYLGAIMGLGIEREKIGDLLIQGNEAFVMTHGDILDYVLHSLDGVSRYGKVTCSTVLKEDIPHFEPEYKSINSTVLSARADAIIATGFEISRSTVVKLIMSGRAMCNGVIITQSTAINEGDTCTLRGHGKIKINEIGSMTKKGRTRVTIHRYI